MEEDFLKLLIQISEKLNYLEEDKSKNALLRYLHATKPDLAEACSQLSMAVDAWLFSRKDMQLHLKAPDLFLIQKQLFIKNLDQKAALLRPFLLELNMDADVKLLPFNPTT